MTNVNKITWLIFFSLPQASSRRGSAKSQINIDLETTEAFCLRGPGFFLSFFRWSSHLALRLVIFPRIKLSWWNKAEGVRQRDGGHSLGLWLLSLMSLSDWWDEAELPVSLFLAHIVCLSLRLSLFQCPFHFLSLYFYLTFLKFFLSVYVYLLFSASFSIHLNSITKSFHWLASLKINLADKSELLLSVSFAFSSRSLSHSGPEFCNVSQKEKT